MEKSKMLKKSNIDEIHSQADDSVEEKIVTQIFEAVIDQRLPHGTKLSESNLCDVFGVSRMRIRRALLLLASREVVEIYSNRGAYIASPSAKQARDVFEARLAIEPNIAKFAVQRATAKDIKKLKKHLKLEENAYKNGHRRDAIRYSGAFHVMLAEIANNGVLLRTIKELVTRSSLIIGIFGSTGIASCQDDDHSKILNAFETNNQDLAAELMSSHLKHIQTDVNLDAKPGSPIDLKTLFERTSNDSALPSESNIL